jgi:transposase
MRALRRSGEGTGAGVATTTPFGPRIHALAIYLKGFQALSYERLRGLFHDAFGLSVSEGASMNMFIRSHARFKLEADKAKAIVRAAKVAASDETDVRIEGTNSYHWVFHCKRAAEAVQARGLKFQGISASMSLLGQRLAMRASVILAQA